MVKLTEQDILNWIGPEDDYMNDDHLAFFRELLVKMQDELIENASVTTGHLQEHESAPRSCRPCHTGRRVRIGTPYPGSGTKTSQ